MRGVNGSRTGPLKASGSPDSQAAVALAFDMGASVMSIVNNLIGAAVIAVAALVSTPAAQAHGRVIIGVAPPALRVEVAPRPRAGYVWSPGYWRWSAGRHVWVGGYWVPARPGWRWVPPHWTAYHGRWRYEPGHWVR
jgi:hypothetical protein